MKFEDWLNKNQFRKYTDIVADAFSFEDQDKFRDWLNAQRTGEFNADWIMLAVSLLSERVVALETAKKDKDKK